MPSVVLVNFKWFSPEYPQTVSYPKLYDASSIDQAKDVYKKGHLNLCIGRVYLKIELRVSSGKGRKTRRTVSNRHTQLLEVENHHEA